MNNRTYDTFNSLSFTENKWKKRIILLIIILLSFAAGIISTMTSHISKATTIVIVKFKNNNQNSVFMCRVLLSNSISHDYSTEKKQNSIIFTFGKKNIKKLIVGFAKNDISLIKNIEIRIDKKTFVFTGNKLRNDWESVANNRSISKMANYIYFSSPTKVKYSNSIIPSLNMLINYKGDTQFFFICLLLSLLIFYISYFIIYYIRYCIAQIGLKKLIVIIATIIISIICAFIFFNKKVFVIWAILGFIFFIYFIIKKKYYSLLSKRIKYFKEQFFLDKISIILFFLMLGAYLFFSVSANTDMIDGKHVLFMDEQISFNQIHNILNPNGLSDFLFSILDGDENRYGRIMYFASAFFSAIPTFLFGIKAQIISTRLLQSLFLISSFIVLTITFIKTWRFRSILLFLLILIPSTVYYSHMPKPEPIQLFFLSLFLFFANKHNFSYGNHYFFLGLAVGAKISALLIMIGFLLLPFLIYYKYHFKDKSIFFASIKTGAITLLGIIAASPIFMFSFFRYLDNMIFNTTHGSDNQYTTIFSWIKSIFANYTGIPEILLIVFIIVSISWVIYLFFIYQIKQKENIIKLTVGLTILFSGLVFIIPIMLKTKRLWLFYLYIGIILILTGYMNLIENLSRFVNYTLRIKSLTKIGNTIIVTLLFYCSFIYSAPKNIRDYLDLANRTEKSDYLQKLKEYNFLIKFLPEISKKINKKLNVYLDPHAFLLESNSFYNVKLFWGPFLYYESNYDIIIFYETHTTRVPLKKPHGSLEYNRVLKSRLLFDKHVTNIKKINCHSNNCYILFQKVISPLIVLIRKNLFIQLNYRSIQN